MQKAIARKLSKSDHELSDVEESHTPFRSPIELEENIMEGASKKKNFSFLDLQSKSQPKAFRIPERSLARSKTEILTELLEKPNDGIKREKSPSLNGSDEFESETNLMLIKKEYEKGIVSRDLDQTVQEISNIKIIQNTFTNMSFSILDETLHISDKVPILTRELKFPKGWGVERQGSKVVEDETPANKKAAKKNLTGGALPFSQHVFRTLIFSPMVSEAAFKPHMLNTYKGLIYAKRFLKAPSIEFLREKLITLPEIKAPKYKSLFLDLDETLIHACQASDNPEHFIKGNDEKGNEILIGLNMRPLCIEFLKKISQYYEVFIFTAATMNYANAIVNFLDPMGQIISKVFSRNNCLMTKNGMFIKDLRIIKNRELKNMIIVDNLAHSFGLQIENGIPILEFQNDKKDRELKYLYDYLLQGLYVDDLRAFNRKNLKLHYLASMKMEDLVKF